MTVLTKVQGLSGQIVLTLLTAGIFLSVRPLACASPLTRPEAAQPSGSPKDAVGAVMDIEGGLFFVPGRTFHFLGSTLGSYDALRELPLAPSHCAQVFDPLGAFNGPEDIYLFTLPYPCEVWASTCGSTNYQSFLGIVDENMRQVAGSNSTSECGFTGATIATCCLPAGNYLLVVDGFYGSSGGYELTVTFGGGICDATPDCEQTPLLACGGSVSGDTSGQLNVVGHPAPDVIYQIEVSQDASLVDLSLCGNAEWDTCLRLFSGCPESPGAVEVAVNEDFCGWNSRLQVVLDAGRYFVVVEGAGQSAGPFTLNLACSSCPELSCQGQPEVEPNDAASLAQSVNADDVLCGTLLASGDTLRDEDWFLVNLPQDGILSASVTVEGLDIYLRLNESLGGLFIAEAENAGFCGSETLISPCMQAGRYLLGIMPSTYAGDNQSKDYQLELSFQACTWTDPYLQCQDASPSATLWDLRRSDLAAPAGQPVTSMADRFRVEGGVTSAVEVVGTCLALDSDWSAIPCVEDPMPFIVRFMDLEGQCTLQAEVLGHGVPVEDTSPWPSLRYVLELPQPWHQESGFVSVVGGGDPDCLFMWNTSNPGSDQTSLMNDGSGWVPMSSDLNFCLLAQASCPSVSDLTIHMADGLATLTWTPIAGATQYRVVGASSAAGPAVELGMVSQPPFVDTATPTESRRFYRVLAICP